MIFLIIISLLILAFVICLIRGDIDNAAGWFMAIFIASIIPLFSYGFHAQDLGTIRAQDNVIIVYEQRVDILQKTLKTITTSNKTILNHDKPITSVVDNLSKAVKELAEAKSEKAEAKVSIAQRKAGWMSFIVLLAGEE
jgi:hypothetical protein